MIPHLHSTVPGSGNAVLIHNWEPVYVTFPMPPPDDRSGFTVNDQNLLCIFGSPLYTYHGFGPATGSTPVPPTGGDMPPNVDGDVIPNGINPGSYLANPDGSGTITGFRYQQVCGEQSI